MASCCNEKRGLRWYTRVRKVKPEFCDRVTDCVNCRHTLGVCDFVIMCTLTIMTRRRVALFRKGHFPFFPSKNYMDAFTLTAIYSNFSNCQHIDLRVFLSALSSTNGLGHISRFESLWTVLKPQVFHITKTAVYCHLFLDTYGYYPIDLPWCRRSSRTFEESLNTQSSSNHFAWW